MKKSGYVLASFDTLAGIAYRFMLGRKGRWNNNFTPEQVDSFLSKTVEGFLHSYGQEFPNKKDYSKYNERYNQLLKKCIDTGFFKNSNIYIDSGGFQISIGRLDRRESVLLMKMYYEWVQENHEMIQRYFILDIPPGPGCLVFNNFKEVYKLNLDSYLKAASLPEKIRSKCIYVHHFRTPQLSKIYTKIMRENDLFRQFEYHGTGGVVANLEGDITIPCIIYILPLIPLLNECKRAGRNYLNFHILGGANYRDVLFYKLFQRVVKDKHNIDLKITFDSSGIFKQTMHARFMYIISNDGNIRKLELKQEQLDKRFLNDKKIYDTFQSCLDELADFTGFKKINIDDIYDSRTGMFHEDVKVYTLFYALYMYDKIENIIGDFVDQTIKHYYNGEFENFDQMCIDMTRRINGGRITKKQVIKTCYIRNSLNALINLDEDFCERITKSFLSKDEFLYLDKKSLGLPVDTTEEVSC